MCDRCDGWLATCRALEGSHPPWSPVPSHCCKRDLGTGSSRPDISLNAASAAQRKGSTLDCRQRTNVVIGTSTNERGKEKEDQQKTYICNVVMAGRIVARRALPPSTPRAFRRDPPGSGG